MAPSLNSAVTIDRSMVKRIAKDLREIRKDLSVVKRRLDDREPLSPMERKLLAQSEENERRGRLMPSARLRAELGACDTK